MDNLTANDQNELAEQNLRLATIDEAGWYWITDSAEKVWVTDND